MDLNFEQTYSLFTDIFDGKISNEDIASILIELDQKGETYEQIAGAAKAMREHALPIQSARPTFDVCGTGGSGKSKPFNISTTSAIILASQGICIAKHGNRAASSVSGSADVLECLRVNILSTPKEMEQSLDENNMAFLFAQILHPKMKYLMPIRKQIAKRTIFNLLGPLTNPSNPERQVVGVSDKKHILPMAKALKHNGKKSAIVLHGEDGLDDATLCGKTFYARFDETNPTIEEGYFTPEQYGFIPVEAGNIEGGKNAKENASIILNILNGTDTGSKRNIVLLNAGIAFHQAKKTGSVEEGIALAEKAIITGEALNLLHKLQ